MRYLDLNPQVYSILHLIQIITHKGSTLLVKGLKDNRKRVGIWERSIVESWQPLMFLKFLKGCYWIAEILDLSCMSLKYSTNLLIRDKGI